MLFRRTVIQAPIRAEIVALSDITDCYMQEIVPCDLEMFHVKQYKMMRFVCELSVGYNVSRETLKRVAFYADYKQIT